MMQASVLDAALPDPPATMSSPFPPPPFLSISPPQSLAISPEQSPFQDTDWSFNWSFF